MTEKKNTDAERAEFEELAKKRGWSITPHGTGYDSWGTQQAWDAWQAARRAPVAPVPQVSIEKLEDWKRRVNSLATCGLKVARYRIGSALKRDIADAISAAPQPPEVAIGIPISKQDQLLTAPVPHLGAPTEAAKLRNEEG